MTLLLLELRRGIHLLLEQSLTDGEHLCLHTLVAGLGRHALALLSLDRCHDGLRVVNHNLVLLEDLFLLAGRPLEEGGRNLQLLNSVFVLLLLVELDLRAKLVTLGLQLAQIELQALDLVVNVRLTALHNDHIRRGFVNLKTLFRQLFGSVTKALLDLFEVFFLTRNLLLYKSTGRVHLLKVRDVSHVAVEIVIIL